MRSFAWRAYAADGTLRTGRSVAQDRAELSRRLRSEGLFPERIDAQDGMGGRLRRPRRLDADMQAVFARQMAVLLSAGLPVEGALAAVQTAGGAGPIDAVSARVRALVQEGAPLSEALVRGSAGFAPFVTSAIAAGEASRDLAASMETVAAHLEGRRTERTALATAVLYPAFVAAVSLVVCAVLMTTVAPELSAMFEATGRPLPPLTAGMLAATDWAFRNAVLIAGSAAALAVGAVLLLRRPAVRDRWDGLLLRLPLAGRLMRGDAAAQYLGTLALVLGSRQPAVEGVRSATGVLSVTRFRLESAEVVAAIEGGASLSRALARASFLPPVALQLVEAGEMSARVAPMTERAAALIETMLVNDRKRIAALIDPLLMMLVGAFVLVVVLSVLLPIFDMQAAISP